MIIRKRARIKDWEMSMVYVYICKKKSPVDVTLHAQCIFKQRERKKKNESTMLYLFFLFFLLTNAQYDYSHMKKKKMPEMTGWKGQNKWMFSVKVSSQWAYWMMK